MGDWPHRVAPCKVLHTTSPLFVALFCAVMQPVCVLILGSYALLQGIWNKGADVFFVCQSGHAWLLHTFLQSLLLLYLNGGSATIPTVLGALVAVDMFLWPPLFYGSARFFWAAVRDPVGTGGTAVNSKTCSCAHWRLVAQGFQQYWHTFALYWLYQVCVPGLLWASETRKRLASFPKVVGGAASDDGMTKWQERPAVYIHAACFASPPRLVSCK